MLKKKNWSNLHIHLLENVQTGRNILRQCLKKSLNLPKTFPFTQFSLNEKYYMTYFESKNRGKKAKQKMHEY